MIAQFRSAGDSDSQASAPAGEGLGDPASAGMGHHRNCSGLRRDSPVGRFISTGGVCCRSPVSSVTRYLPRRGRAGLASFNAGWFVASPLDSSLQLFQGEPAGSCIPRPPRHRTCTLTEGCLPARTDRPKGSGVQRWRGGSRHMLIARRHLRIAKLRCYVLILQLCIAACYCIGWFIGVALAVLQGAARLVVLCLLIGAMFWSVIGPGLVLLLVIVHSFSLSPWAWVIGSLYWFMGVDCLISLNSERQDMPFWAECAMRWTGAVRQDGEAGIQTPNWRGGECEA